MSKENFIRRLANHIQGKYDLANQELTVVFPNKRAAFYLRNEFQGLYRKNIWLPQMLSIQEAVTQWSGITLVDTIEMLFELIDIDAQLHKEQDSDLGVFGSQAAQMAKDFDEIDQYDIDAKKLFNYVVDNKKMEIWDFDEAKSKEKELKYLQFFTSLHDYYLRLRDRLSEKKQGYYGLITKHLAHISDEELAQRIGERKVIFAGFNALTTTEERIIDKLVKNGHSEVIFDYDRYYIDDEQNEAGRFARRYLAEHPKWMENGISEKLLQEEKHIHIISASGNTLQVKALQFNIQKNVHNDMAIILADENLLIPMLNAIPDTEIFSNFKVSMGYPIKQTPVNQLVNAFFSLYRRNRITRKATENGIIRTVDGWYIWPVLQSMDLELVKIIFSKEELAVFNRWKSHAVGSGKFIFEQQDIESLKDAKDVQEFLRLLLCDHQIHEPKTALSNLIHLIKFISNKIQSKNNNKEWLFLLNQVSEIGKILYRIGQVIERHEHYLRDANSVEILYKLLSANSSIKLNSSSTEGLQIMGLLETRNIDFTQLHMLSVNEGIMPADKSQGSFIPHYIRKECGLPGYQEKQAVFAYHFYRLLQNGKDIYLYYNNLGESSGGEASRYLLQIKHELSHLPNIRIEEKNFDSDSHTVSENIPLSAQKAESSERLKLLVFEKGISPSALSTYINCPLNYYLKYIAQIEDCSLEEEVGANIVGTIMHDTLEFLFEPYLPKDGTAQIIDKELFDKAIMPDWEAKLAQSIEKNLPSGFPDVGFNYLNKITIRQQLRNYIQYTSNQLKNKELSILKTEGELAARLDSPVGSYLFKGRTDRIDRWGNVIRIVDYKTGRVENADLRIPVRHDTDNALSFLKSIPEKAMQLLLYKYMYLKENPQISANQVETCIHGLRYSNSIEFGLSNAKPTKNENYIPFLEDNNFINDMEEMLSAIVAEMLDATVPFTQTDDEKKCRNCDFKVICKR